eukprot:TRINITY_DN2678_c0_g1_i2.p3 TRINITY_DN2678_c0_g1~~TRINITY_DN2678_c0_g1_i2.p3  ORF type:complete len:135 (-),score=15.65 TRINITY_DN2678_c0_g1_i2:31-435(-)
MDHHCPWIGGCVGRHNYKFFYLVLVYTVLLDFAAFVFFFILFWTGVLRWGQVHSLILLCGSVAFSVFILLAFHTHLLLFNQTTIEFFSNPEFKTKLPTLSKRGMIRNIENVLGEKKIFWLVPDVFDRSTPVFTV